MTVFTTLEKEKKLLAFVEKARDWFAANPQGWTYSSLGNLDGEDEYLAIRWGAGNDCIKLVKLDQDFDPMLYQQALPRLTAREIADALAKLE